MSRWHSGRRLRGGDRRGRRGSDAWLCVAAYAVALAWAVGCGEPPTVYGERVSPDEKYSEIRFFRDGGISLNTSCPMTGLPIHPEREPVYVNGRPVGFC